MNITLERIMSLMPQKPDGSPVHGAKKIFCDKVGLAPNTVTEWLAGRSQSYYRYLYQIGEAYGVSVAWLRGETDEKKPAPKEGGTLSPETETDELREYLEMLRNRPECRMLLSTVKGATKEEVEANVKLIEALRGFRG